MALVLVVADDFGTYRRGTIITNPTVIDQIRSGEFADRIVMVSDEIIPPPQTPDSPNISELIARYQSLTELTNQQQIALAAAVALNQEQTIALSQQSAQIGSLTQQVTLLAAQIENPNGGTPLPPDLADDVPLAEDDGVELSTDSGAVLVGDVRQ